MALRMLFKRRNAWIAAPMLWLFPILTLAQGQHGTVTNVPDALGGLNPPPPPASNSTRPPVRRASTQTEPPVDPARSRSLDHLDTVEEIEEAEGARRPVTPILNKQAVPWTNQAGQRLVGVVEDREMTEAEMRRRANMLLQLAPKIESDASSREAFADDEEKLTDLRQQMIDDRRMTYESTVLKEWIQVTTLAVHAEKTGITVTDQEVDQALNQLSSLSGTQGEQQQKGLTLIGVAENDLRREVRDSVLVEKLLDRTLAENVTQAQKQAFFAKSPEFFLPPTRVRAWQLFRPQIGRMTTDQASKTAKEMKTIGKLLKKSEDDEASLQAMRDVIKEKYPSYTLSDLGWIEEGQTMPAAKVLFSTNPGDVSEVVNSNLGLLMVRVFERSEGGNTFEDALPQINNALHGQLRDVLYNNIKGKYNIYQGASGLNHMVDKEPSQLVRPIADAPPVTAPEPDLSPLRSTVPSVEEATGNPRDIHPAGDRPLFSDPPELR